MKTSLALLSYRVEPAELIEGNAVINGRSEVAINVPHVQERTVDAIEGEVPHHGLDVERLIGLTDTLAQHVLHEGVVILGPLVRPPGGLRGRDGDHVESPDLIRQISARVLRVKDPVLHLVEIHQVPVRREGDIDLLVIFFKGVGSNLHQSERYNINISSHQSRQTFISTWALSALTPPW